MDIIQMTWESVIETSLGELDAFIKKEGWYGRENEIISLYAHHFLSKKAGNEPFQFTVSTGLLRTCLGAFSATASV